MKKITVSFLLVIFFIVLPSDSHAYKYRQEVLALTDQNLDIPPTTGGPGLILPDSPLFFLDQIKQEIRLIAALTPEDKAKVHQSIAEERLAELRVMLQNKNDAAVKSSLDAVTQNLKLAGEDLNDAKLTGRNVTGLAKSINDDIKLKQESLDVLESQAQGELEDRVKAASQGLTETKVQVEDHLAPEDLDNEIKSDLERKSKKDVHELRDSVEEIQNTIDDLSEQASESGKKLLKSREELLKKSIDEKNEKLKKILEQQVEQEKKKNEKVMETKKKALEDAVKEADKINSSAENLNKSLESNNNSGSNGGSGSSNNSGSDGSNSTGSSGSSGSSGGGGSDNSGSGSSGSSNSGGSGDDK